MKLTFQKNIGVTVVFEEKECELHMAQLFLEALEPPDEESVLVIQEVIARIELRLAGCDLSRFNLQQVLADVLNIRHFSGVQSLHFKKEKDFNKCSIIIYMKFDLYYPCKLQKVNQKFGENFTDMYKKLGLLGHNGIDLWAPDSWIVRAAHTGRVTFTGYDGSGGLGVVIRTEKEYDYKDGVSYFKTIYWHLKKDTIRVTGGQTVKAGDIIALADNTGMSTGSHLHFGLKPIYKGEQDWEWGNVDQLNGYWGAIDPAPYWNGIYAEDISPIIAKLELLKQKVAELVAAFTKLKK